MACWGLPEAPLRSLLLVAVLAGCAAPPADTAPPDPFILGGTLADDPAYDAVVSLQLRDYDGSFMRLPHCSGTVIRSGLRAWVLTAAHCLVKDPNSLTIVPLQPRDLAVYTGQDPYLDLQDHLVPVQRVVVYPGYDRARLEGDLGLVQLTIAPEGIVPVQEDPAAEALSDADAGLVGDLVGFGYDQNGTIGPKRHVFEPLGGVGCGDACIGGADPETHLWMDLSDGTGICFGDSGGPWLFPRPDGVRIGGLGSYVGVRCTGYGVDTKVDRFEEWIVATAGRPCTDGVCPDEDVTPPVITVLRVREWPDAYRVVFVTSEPASCTTCDDGAPCTATSGRRHVVTRRRDGDPTITCADPSGNTSTKTVAL